MISALLVFASLPVSHGPRLDRPADQPERAFFVAEMRHLIREDEIPFSSRETATPVLDDAGTRMYLGTTNGYVRCLLHGEVAWVWRAGGSVLAAPLLDGPTLYVASADGKLTALNRITGEVRWQADVHEELTTTPSIGEGKLFVMSSEESVTAVDVKDGKTAWKFHRDPPAGFTIRGNARPVVAHGLVFAGFADGTVAALGPADGAPRWTRAVSGTGEYLDIDALAASEDDPRIYAASSKVGVVALDAQSGVPAWTTALPGANHLLADGPRVYASGKGVVVGIDRRTGTLLWRYGLGNDAYATAAGASFGLLLIARDRGPLIALDAVTGRSRGLFDPGSGFSGAPLVVPGGAFIISNAGTLFGLGLLQ